MWKEGTLLGPEPGTGPLVAFGRALVPASCSRDTNFPTSTSREDSNLPSETGLFGDFLPGSASPLFWIGSLGASIPLAIVPLGVRCWTSSSKSWCKEGGLMTTFITLSFYTCICGIEKLYTFSKELSWIKSAISHKSVSAYLNLCGFTVLLLTYCGIFGKFIISLYLKFSPQWNGNNSTSLLRLWRGLCGMVYLFQGLVPKKHSIIVNYYLYYYAPRVSMWGGRAKSCCKDFPAPQRVFFSLGTCHQSLLSPPQGSGPRGVPPQFPYSGPRQHIWSCFS